MLGDTQFEHRPVLLAEAVEALVTDSSGFYVDATFGRGGHTLEILNRLGPEGRLLAIDRDPEALAYGAAQFAGESRLQFWHGNFADLDQALVQARPVHGLLLDLGVSSPQLDDPSRGFSFSSDGPLDMRMNPQQGQSAAQWLAVADAEEIARVLWRYGEERHSRRIARAIVQARQEAPIQGTAALASIIAAAQPRSHEKKHPATRSFQAIRIHINGELDAISQALDKSINLLAPGGRLVVISFHSLEDRLVKQFMRGHARRVGNRRLPPEAQPRPLLKLLGGARKAGEAELGENPRARSAVMRVAEKCPG